MKEIFLDTIIDVLKILPFLFVAFIIMELMEHRVQNRKNILKNKKLGPFFGGLLGIIPQCGFSVMATNLFSSKVITIGTLLAVYLSTSDEMLPLLISHNASIKLILTILLIKFIIGIMFGYLLDLFYKRENNKEEFSICEKEHCHCEEGIFKSSLIHTMKICFYIFITTFVLNILIHYLGEERIGALLLKNNIFGPFLACIVGLIPNCASSVIITELYLSKVITCGMLIGGLLTGAGIGVLVLFKVNKNKKENILLLLSLYIVGVMVGILIDLLGIKF